MKLPWQTGKLTPAKRDEDEKKVLPFGVIEGGKLKTGGKEPPTHDWLTELPVNTTFLATPKIGFDPLCGQFKILDQREAENKESAVQLYQDGHEFWVMASRFCHKMRLVLVIERGNE
jgi:hypothetical protein